MGTPPIKTLGLADTVNPTMGPVGGSDGFGEVKVQCFVTSTARLLARIPSIQTLEDPRNTSYIGKYPPHQIPNPMSPHLAAGIPFMSVLDAPDKIGIGITGPVLGNGTGTGLGGVKLGGWLCACGSPTSISAILNAGIAGKGITDSGRVTNCSIEVKKAKVAPMVASAPFAFDIAFKSFPKPVN